MRGKLFLLVIWLGAALVAEAAGAKIIKVLPHFLDREGRHALNPSLYERDAYQERLRRNPDLRSALRFDVQWRAADRREVTLRVEARGGKGSEPTQVTLQQVRRPKRWFSSWTGLTLGPEEYAALGDLVAWRVTLWDGETLLAEQRSFLW